MRLRLLVLLAICLDLPLQAQTDLNLSQSRINEIFSEFNRSDSPGCSLGIIEEQQLVFARGYGRANLEYALPLNADSVFRIGSTSKQFTAMAIQLLIRDGKLSLEDDIRKFLPEIPDYGEPIRVQHLLHHTSGLRDYLTLMSLAGLRSGDFYTNEQVLAMLARQRELNFPPGDQFLYSNSGYFLLAEIVKRVSGQSLRDFARQRIFKPLGMTSSHFHNHYREIVQRRASGYRRSSNGFEISMTTLEMIGDGGVFTSIRDLSRWDANFYTGRVGGKDVIEALQQTGRLNDGSPLEYASGLFVSEYRGLPTVRHGGSFVGFRAELLRFPGEQTSIICLCNLAQTNPSRLADQVADVILKGRFPEVAASLQTPAAVDLEPLAGEAARACLGAWETEEGELWRVVENEGRIWVQFPSRRFPLMTSASQPGSWLVSEPGLSLELKLSSSQQGTAILNGRHLKLRLVTLADPTPALLRIYTGVYSSPELGIDLEVSVQPEGLELRNTNLFRDSPRSPFRPATPDRFDSGNTHIIFERATSGQIASFRLSAGRVRNILFLKQNPGQEQ